jgi:hypothetical protein
MEFIKGYENLYKINKQGEIYSCGKGIIMKPQETEDGYLYVNLIGFDKEGNKKKIKHRIHRLLALQYIPNPDNKPEIDHIDRNKHNNSLDNLRWVSKIENRNNRPDIIENLTEEQKEERLNKIKQYKKEWAEKDRREKGIQIKAEMNKSKTPEYKVEQSRKYRAKMTPEQKAEHLKKRRENRKPLTEEQKEKAKERARKRREKIKNDEELKEKIREYKKNKATEYRNKKKLT